MQSEFIYTRTYHGNVKALILDWSGTVADAYVIAPAVVFVDVFEKQGVEISMEEARGPMGLRKDLHIAALTQEPEIRERWRKVKDDYPTQDDVDNMFGDFVPMQLDCLRRYTTLLPGVAETTEKLRPMASRLAVLRALFEAWLIFWRQTLKNRASMQTSP